MKGGNFTWQTRYLRRLANIGVLETSTLDKINGKNVYGCSRFLGINTYKAVDPIVFSFTGSYRFNLNNSTDHKVGNYWLLRAGVSFATNDRTTLSANLKWTGKNSDRIKGKRIGTFASDTYADFGVGYSFVITGASAFADDTARLDYSAKHMKPAVKPTVVNLYARKGQDATANRDIGNLLFQEHAKELAILSQDEMEKT